MPTKSYKLDFPIVGPTEIAKWDYRCSPPVNAVRVPLLAAGGIDVELSLEKIKDAVGELGSLLPDGRMQKFIKTAKTLAPSGKIGLKVALMPEVQTQWCPGFEKQKASYLSFVLRLTLVGNVEGTYGVVNGKAYALLAFELASDAIFCDCPSPPVDKVSLNEFGAVGLSSEVLLASGPAISAPVLPIASLIQQTKEEKVSDLECDSEEASQEYATLTVTDEDGTTRVLKKFQIF